MTYRHITAKESQLILTASASGLPPAFIAKKMRLNRHTVKSFLRVNGHSMNDYYEDTWQLLSKGERK